jgi:hypothetical protein
METADAHAERVARVLGPGCAAAQAIRERDKRREDGESVFIFYGKGNYWVVGPYPSDKGTIIVGKPRNHDGSRRFEPA